MSEVVTVLQGSRMQQLRLTVASSLSSLDALRRPCLAVAAATSSSCRSSLLTMPSVSYVLASATLHWYSVFCWQEAPLA